MVPVLLVLAAVGLLAVAASAAYSQPLSAPPRNLSPTIVALARKWATARSLPLSWLLAVISVESSGNPRASNTSVRAMQRGGAWGLAQMTLDTAKELAPAALKGYSTLAKKWNGTGESLLDPDLNLALASYYLARLAREFGSFERMAAAYHSGPATVRRLIAEGALPAGLGTQGQLAVRMYNDALAKTSAIV